MVRVLRLIAGVFGTICIGFGINALYNPQSALSFFGLDYPRNDVANKVLIDTLLAVYAARDIFEGVVMCAAAYYGNKKTLGAITLALSAVAIADGVICKVIVGHGQWNHWGFAPMAVLLGLVCMVA